MFIVGKSFFSEILSKFNIKTIVPLCIIQISTLWCWVGCIYICIGWTLCDTLDMGGQIWPTLVIFCFGTLWIAAIFYICDIRNYIKYLFQNVVIHTIFQNLSKCCSFEPTVNKLLERWVFSSCRTDKRITTLIIRIYIHKHIDKVLNLFLHINFGARQRGSSLTGCLHALLSEIFCPSSYEWLEEVVYALPLYTMNTQCICKSILATYLFCQQFVMKKCVDARTLSVRYLSIWIILEGVPVINLNL